MDGVPVAGGCWGVWECKGGDKAHASSQVCLQEGRWDTAGAGEKGCAPRVGPCVIKMTSAGSCSREERQLPSLLLPPTAFSGQEGSK